MSDAFETIRIVLKSIEFQKAKIIEIETNPNIPYRVKTDKLLDMRATLIRTQAAVAVLMHQELDSLKKAS